MKESKIKISIVIPIYNEEASILWHHKVISEFVEDKKYATEFVYINDGSDDSSLILIKKLAVKDRRVRYISFSRNFGKEAATTAGLKHAGGDAVIIMDGDGQHPVQLIDKFIELWEDGYDSVVGVRKSNVGEGFLKKFGSKFFYTILKLIGGKDVIAGTTDFRLLDRKIVNEFNKLTERNRVTRNLLDWLGYRKVEVQFDANERHAGSAAYSFKKLTKLAIDGVISHSTRPLKAIALLGLLISVLSALSGVFLVTQEFLLGDPLHLSVSGTAFLAIFVTFLVGIVLVCQGLLALYIESVYYETQNRPLFVISEEL